MNKKHRVIKEISQVIEDAAKEAVSELLQSYKRYKGMTKSKETDISADLGGEITRHLVRRIKEKLDRREIKGVKFEVSIFNSQSQEPFVGADLLGVLEIDIGETKISKAYLAQAKGNKSSKVGAVIFGDKLLQGQVSDMLAITSDSFVFVYTNDDIHVVPAFAAQLNGANRINLKDIYYRSFGSFYQEFFKCFIGDHHIVSRGITTDDLTNIAKEIKAKNTLMIKVRSLQGRFDFPNNLKEFDIENQKLVDEFIKWLETKDNVES